MEIRVERQRRSQGSSRSTLETTKLAGIDPAEYLRAAALADARGEVVLPADVPR